METGGAAFLACFTVSQVSRNKSQIMFMVTSFESPIQSVNAWQEPLLEHVVTL